MLVRSEALLQSVLAIAIQAGEHLRRFYQQSAGVNVRLKADNTPVTEADLFVSQFLTQQLSQLTPNIPVLSEENCHIPFSERQQWQQYWLIDPLDGTQQFIDRTDQFAILIALVQQYRPTLGIIHAPILQRSFYAMQGYGAYQQSPQSTQRLSRQAPNRHQPLKIAIGSSYSQQKVRSILPENFACEFLVYGSSGLKSTLVATGECDCYVRLGNTGEWDTAAAEIILSEMGGKIFDSQFQPLTYNQRHSLINPDFVMVAQGQRDWQKVFRFYSRPTLK